MGSQFAYSLCPDCTKDEDDTGQLRARDKQLRDAVMDGAIGRVRTLIKSGASVNKVDTNKTDSKGIRPLAVAAIFGRIDMVRLLLESRRSRPRSGRFCRGWLDFVNTWQDKN